MGESEDEKEVSIAWMGSVIAPVLHRIVKKYKISEEDIQALFIAGANRAIDAKGLVHGGKLSTGEEVQGLVALEQRLDVIGGQLQLLVDRLLEPDPEDKASTTGEEVNP